MQNKLRQERQIKGLSQQQLADTVGVSRPSISNIERGEVIPGGDLVLKIAKAIGKPVEQIFFTNDVMQVERET